jgi:hypothetical protein
VCDIFPDASVRGVEINRTVAPGMPASVAPSITFTVSVTVAACIGSTIANNARNPRTATFTAYALHRSESRNRRASGAR